MITKYSIVQFLPDPSNDERVNIGIVAFDDDGRTSHAFINNWERVRSFANLKNDGKLERSVKEMICSISKEWIEWAVDGMSHSIQLSTLRVSSQSLSEVISRAAEQLLIDPPARHLPKRTKESLRRIATQAVETTLAKIYDIDDLSIGSLVFPGRVANHKFDVAAQNGSPLLAAPVVSLIQTNRDVLFRQIGTAAWALQDIEASGNVERRALFIISDKDSNKDAQEQVKSVFPQYGVDVVEYEAVDKWAKRLAKSFV